MADGMAGGYYLASALASGGWSSGKAFWSTEALAFIVPSFMAERVTTAAVFLSHSPAAGCPIVVANLWRQCGI